MNDNLKYKAQALAIAMVVLVVSSLIAISIYSRTMKDKGLTLEERASAEALEVSDVLLDRLSQFPISKVIEVILDMDLVGVEDDLYGTGIVLKENSKGANNITDLFRTESLQIIDSSETVSDLLSPLCPISQGGEYQITLKEADEDTYYEIKPGNIWSLPVKNLMKQDGCALNLKLAVRGDRRAGFVLMKIYCNYDDNGNVISCKEYDFGGLGEEYMIKNDDIVNYCFSDKNKIECNNPNFRDDANWEKYYPEAAENERYIEAGIFNSSADPENPTGFMLSEVRIKAIGGTIGISYFLPDECLTGFRMFQLRATANCSGVYRGKEILIPEQKWHNAIFDYVIFNGEGSL